MRSPLCSLRGRISPGVQRNGSLVNRRLVNERADLCMCGEQGFDLLTELKVIPADVLEISGPFSRVGELQRGLEQFLLRWPVGVHVFVFIPRCMDLGLMVEANATHCGVWRVD